jgi:antitoxin component YwqK of YwqJK toxin-antitoxin module
MSDVKKKLFIPRKIDERLVDWNKQQPVIDGVQINQYDLETGNPTGRWGEGDIDGGDTINLFATYWDVFSDDAWDDVTESTNNKDYIFNYMVKKIREDFIDALSEDGPLGWTHFDLTLPLDSQEVRDEFEFLYNENPPITESKKLFIPRKLSGEDSRYSKWNEEQPIVNGIQINQYDLDGKGQGYWEHYNSDGKYTNKGEYVDGLRNGIWKSISDDGILIHNGLYRYGERVKFLPLDESKKLFIPRKLSDDDSRYSKWNKEQPIVDGERINQYDSEGRRQGLWVEYLDGNIASKKEYINGKVDGIDQSFYDNGQIQFDGHQKNNEFDGLWKMYYRTGQLKEIGNYENSYKQGVWKWYYPFENQLETIVKYVDGRPDGLAMEYFANGNIWKKMVYRLGKKIAYIIYTYDGDVNESINWKDEYDNMVINEQIENKDDILKSWGNYYGSDDTANWELDSYESEVEDLIENGGNIYRVLFVDNLSKINLKDMGNHWTTSRDNVIDVAEINQQYYGKNKQKVIVIEGYVEPNSITIEGVDVKGNPHEKEVNIKEGKGVKIKQIFEYVGRKFIPIDMNINEQMEDKDNILKSFEPQKELNPKVWDEDGKLKKKIKDTLVAIGQEFHKTLEVEAPIDDIIFTGSLANYNWSQYSDVDLHVLMDFNEFDDKELIKKYFDAKKAVWNDNHDIKIKGYDVELYAQDKDEPHESTGIYSVMNDEWIKKPKPQDVKIDRETIKKKVKQFEGEYNRILKLYKEEKYEETRKALDKIKDKIKKYRKAGLDKGGEMATENLVFKTMRRSGLMEKIYDLGLETTDKEYTIETIDESKKLFIPRKLEGEGSRWEQWNKEQPIVNGNPINQYDSEGRKQGYWEENLSNSLYKLNSKGNYVDDVKDGMWVNYHSDGSIWYEEEFKNGDSTKTIIYYYENDELESKKVFVNNKYVKDLPLTESKNINEGKLSDNIDEILKNFKKNFGLDVGFLTSFGAGINGLIKNMSSLIKEYTTQPLSKFEITNLAIAMIVVYLRKNKSLKDFKDEMLSIVAFTSLMPGYNDMVNSLLGNVDFMGAFMTIIKSVGVYSMLNHFKSK